MRYTMNYGGLGRPPLFFGTCMMYGFVTYVQYTHCVRATLFLEILVGLNITPRVAKVNTRAFRCLRKTGTWICFDVVCNEIQETQCFTFLLILSSNG